MQQQQDLFKTILSCGRRRKNRTGIDTIGIFGHMARYNLKEGFPIPTTRKIFTRGIWEELGWFIRGGTNIQYLTERDVHIWDEWAANKDTVVAHRQVSRAEAEYACAVHAGMLEDGQSYEEAGITVEDIVAKIREFASTAIINNRPATEEELENHSFCLYTYCAQNEIQMMREVTLGWFEENLVVTTIEELAEAVVEKGVVESLEQVQELFVGKLKDHVKAQMLEQGFDEEALTDEALSATVASIPEIQTVQILCAAYDITFADIKPTVKTGDLGPVYGKVWTDWDGINQLDMLVESLKTQPYSRRHIISAWKVDVLPVETLTPQQNVVAGRQALAPCHVLSQYYVEDLEAIEIYDLLKAAGDVGRGIILEILDETNTIVEQSKDDGKEHEGEDFIIVQEGMLLAQSVIDVATRYVGKVEGVFVKRLSSLLFQRSADAGVGHGFNVASYATLTHMLAQQCDYDVGDFVHFIGDAHIYVNQLDAIHEQMERECRPLPKLVIKRKPESIADYTAADFELDGYDPHPAIQFPRPAV